MCAKMRREGCVSAVTTAAELKDAIWNREIELHHEAEEGREWLGFGPKDQWERDVLPFLADRNIV